MAALKKNVTAKVTSNVVPMVKLNAFEQSVFDMGESFIKNGRAAFAQAMQDAWRDKKYDFGSTQESIDAAANKLIGLYAQGAKLSTGSLKSFKATALTYVRLAVLERLDEVRKVTAAVTENLGDALKEHMGQDPFGGFAKLNRRVSEAKAENKALKLDVKVGKTIVKKKDAAATDSTPADKSKVYAKAIETLAEGATEAQLKAIAAVKKAFGIK